MYLHEELAKQLRCLGNLVSLKAIDQDGAARIASSVVNAVCKGGQPAELLRRRIAQLHRPTATRVGQHATRKRPVEPERLERMVSGIVRQLESSGESDIKASDIGNLVMEGLKVIDDVAYVRFASVYKNFREAKDFEALLDEMSGPDAAAFDET